MVSQGSFNILVYVLVSDVMVEGKSEHVEAGDHFPL